MQCIAMLEAQVAELTVGNACHLLCLDSYRQPSIVID